MKVTIEVDDEVTARLQALVVNVEDLVRRYLGGLADADKFKVLSKVASGDSRG